jgi:hypothetical protein
MSMFLHIIFVTRGSLKNTDENHHTNLTVVQANNINLHMQPMKSIEICTQSSSISIYQNDRKPHSSKTSMN